MIKILVADDDPNIRNGLKKVIGDNITEDIIILEAADGNCAYEIAAAENVQILITDMKMPRCSGQELIDRLKAAGHSCKVIVLSGFDDYSLVRAALKAGAVDYLLKPIEIPEMISIITQQIESIKNRLEIAAAPPTEEEYVQKGEGEYLIKKAKIYIEDNFAKELQLSEIAGYLYLHPNYFSTFFKNKTGCTFSNYLKKVRIEHAKLLMKTTNMKIYEISECVGYKDPTHFFKAFKEVTGATPKSFWRSMEP